MFFCNLAAPDAVERRYGLPVALHYWAFISVYVA